MHIGNIIEDRISQQGRTKIWVSEKCGIDYKTFVDKLKNDRLTAQDLFKVAIVLNMDLNHIKEMIRKEEREMNRNEKDMEMISLDRELLKKVAYDQNSFQTKENISVEQLKRMTDFKEGKK